MTPPRESSSERPRVLHWITRVGLGGAERVAASLVRGLHDEFDFGIYAVRGIEDSDVGRDLQRQFEQLGAPIFCGPNVPIKFGGMILAGFRGTQVCRAFRPHVSHLHTEIPESAFAAMQVSPTAPRAALVRTIHNSVYWRFWPALGRWCERRLRRSHVACVSNDARQAFAEHRAQAGAGPLPTLPTVIRNGVDPASRRRTPHCSPDAPLRVLYAGRFEFEKGTDLLPEILRQTPAPARGAECVLYGRGVHAARLHELSARPPPGWIVRVLPPAADLRERMTEFDLCVMPSRSEGLGLTAIEATLAGLPVVATDAPGLREALPPEYPWRSQPGDPAAFARALRTAIDHPEDWPAAVARAEAFARENFSVPVMREQYTALYRAALREG